jgi:hypothetical protein
VNVRGDTLCSRRKYVVVELIADRKVGARDTLDILGNSLVESLAILIIVLVSVLNQRHAIDQDLSRYTWNARDDGHDDFGNSRGRLVVMRRQPVGS